MLDKQNRQHLWALAAIAATLGAVLHADGLVPQYKHHTLIYAACTFMAIMINTLCILTMINLAGVYRKTRRFAKACQRALNEGATNADVKDYICSPERNTIIKRYIDVRESYAKGYHLHPLTDLFLYGTMIYVFGVHLATGVIDVIFATFLCIAMLCDFNMRCEADRRAHFRTTNTHQEEQTQ